MSTWNLVRLELARNPEFPEGSASRAYMLRVPLDDVGLIDQATLARRPGMAIVRRFWPNEADQTGHLVPNGSGWMFSYSLGDDDDEKVGHLAQHPLRVGNYVTITEPDGKCYPYKVARSHPDGVAGA